MLHCEVVEQLDVAGQELEVHPQRIAASQGIEDGKSLPLLGGHPGNVCMPLSQMVVGACVID